MCTIEVYDKDNPNAPKVGLSLPVEDSDLLSSIIINHKEDPAMFFEKLFSYLKCVFKYKKNLINQTKSLNETILAKEKIIRGLEYELNEKKKLIDTDYPIQTFTESNYVKQEREKFEKLEKANEALHSEISCIRNELELTQQKLILATSRLYQQTVKPGIAGGKSNSDKLKGEFVNLKSGLLRNLSERILDYWRNHDPQLTFRSNEFFQIRSILSKSVFIEGMVYFGGNKAEIDENVRLIVNDLLLIEGLSPVLQLIEKSVESSLRRLKGINESKEPLDECVDKSVRIILENLSNVRDYSLPDDILYEIRAFAEVALKFVIDVLNDYPSGELYTPEIGDKYDEALHDTRDEPEGRIKLVICTGYRIPGNILVRADVLLDNSGMVNAQNSTLQSAEFHQANQDVKYNVSTNSLKERLTPANELAEVKKFITPERRCTTKR